MGDYNAIDPADGLISVSAAAQKIGVQVATLMRWHSRNQGPAAVSRNDRELAYRFSDLEAWQDRFAEPITSGPAVPAYVDPRCSGGRRTIAIIT